MSGITTCADCGAAIHDVPSDASAARFPCVSCGSTARSYRIISETGRINLSPFAFQWYAKDFYNAYKAHLTANGSSTFSPARLALIAQSVELAAKSLHVHQGKRDSDLRKLGHNLVKACDAKILGLYGITIDASEQAELQNLSDLNELKAFEYFWFPGPGVAPEVNGILHAVHGRPGLPDEKIVQGLLVRLLTPQL